MTALHAQRSQRTAQLTCRVISCSLFACLAVLVEGGRVKVVWRLLQATAWLSERSRRRTLDALSADLHCADAAQLLHRLLHLQAPSAAASTPAFPSSAAVSHFGCLLVQALLSWPSSDSPLASALLSLPPAEFVHLACDARGVRVLESLLTPTQPTGFAHSLTTQLALVDRTLQLLPPIARSTPGSFLVEKVQRNAPPTTITPTLQQQPIHHLPLSPSVRCRLMGSLSPRLCFSCRCTGLRMRSAGSSSPALCSTSRPPCSAQPAGLRCYAPADSSRSDLHSSAAGELQRPTLTARSASTPHTHTQTHTTPLLPSLRRSLPRAGRLVHAVRLPSVAHSVVAVT